DRAAAHRVLVRSINLWEKFVEEFPDELGFQVDLAGAYVLLGALEGGQRAEESMVFFRKAIAILERLRNEKEPRYREALAFAYETAKYYASRAGRPVWEEWTERCLALYEELAAECPSVPSYQRGVAHGLSVLGTRYAMSGRNQEAAAAFRRSLD